MPPDTPARAFVEGDPTVPPDGAGTRPSPGRGDLARPSPAAEGASAPPVAGGGGRCRVCGCGDLTACVGADGLPCAWIEQDLCTACAGTTATALLGRFDRLDAMARLAHVGAAEPMEGEAPVEWAVAVRWPDGRTSVGAAGRSASSTSALLREASARVAAGGATPLPEGWDVSLVPVLRRSAP